MKPKKRGMRVWLIVLASLFVFISNVCGQILADGHEKLLARISPTNVLAGMTPVLIWENSNTWCATGLLVTPTNNSPRFIVTCAHEFLTNHLAGPAYFEYQIARHALQPFDEKFYPIEKIETDVARDDEDPKRILDIALCYPGKLRKIDPIAYTNSYNVLISKLTGLEKTPFKFILLKKPEPVESSATAEKVTVIGQTKANKYGQVFYILLYDGMESEDGTIFVEPHRELYVMSTTLAITPEIRKYFKLPPEMKTIALASKVTLNKK
jgi:hypothetical protein